MVGFLPPMPDAAIESRHLGLKTAGEIADLQQKIQILTAAAQKNIDWPRLLALFDRPAPMAASAVQAAAPTVRIAVAQDEAFCFTYAETLESLQAAGAELCFFSPLTGCRAAAKYRRAVPAGRLPGAVRRPAGGQHRHALRINTAVQSGLPTVAECGGFFYLGQTLEDAGTAYPMAGVLPGQGFRSGGSCALATPRLTPQADSMLFRAGEPLPVHEFHHWDSTGNGTAFAAQSQRPPLGLRLCQRAFLCGVPASILGGHAAAAALCNGCGAVRPNKNRENGMTEPELKTRLQTITPPDEGRPRRGARPLGRAGKTAGRAGQPGNHAGGRRRPDRHPGAGFCPPRRAGAVRR